MIKRLGDLPVARRIPLLFWGINLVLALGLAGFALRGGF